ncbi:MAG TPA: HAMP domain-containing sensor histidine kinase [Anaerolineales bacterium]|nr:HAMP domain-containing sensor histidine kinase [Anaerolineales bacterium]
MQILENLEMIRPAWSQQVAAQMARGVDVRLSFAEQLDHFYAGLIQAIATGDPTRVEPVLNDWILVRSQSELKADKASLAPLVDQMLLSLSGVAGQALTAEDALALVGAALPVFSHVYTYTNQEETRLNFENYSRELEAVKLSLEELDKSKSDFISIASHELRTPLTLIEGYSAMLLENLSTSARDEQTAVLLHGIEKGTRRMHEIIEDMIDVSMIDNHLLELNFQPVWMDRLVNQVVHGLSSSISDRQQNLEIRSFEGFNGRMFADNERLYQALYNLVANAIKFTPDHGKVTIGGRCLPGFMELTIQDTGIGIDQEDQARVFDKFTGIRDASLHSSSKTGFKGGGPGLGLAIAKGIIDAHGGTIWVESEGYDEQAFPGTTFHVLIPNRDRPPEERISELFERTGGGKGLLNPAEKPTPYSIESGPASS